MAFVYNGILLAAVTASPPLFPLQAPGAQLGYPPANSLPITSLGLVATVSTSFVGVYSVQISGDNPELTGGIVNWNNHDVIVNASTSLNSNIAYPVSALRLNVTSWVSGSVNLGVVQWP